MADSFLGDVLMGIGQSVSGQPYLTNFEKLKQDASQWRDSMAQKQIENAQAQQKINIDQSQANNQLGQNAIYMSAMSGGTMTPQQYMAAMSNLHAPPLNQAPASLPPSPGSTNMLPQAPSGPQPPSAQQTGLSAIQSNIQSMGMMPSMSNGKLSWKPAMGALPTDQVQSMAKQLVSGQLMPSELGGIRGSGKAQVLQAAQALDPTYNPASADMNYAAQKMGVSSFTKNFANLQSFKSDFDKNAQLLLQYSNQLDRSKYPMINKAIMAGKLTIEGDPIATKFAQGINTVVNGYAKLQNPSLSGQALTDAARGEASDLLNKLQSGQQLDALLNPKYGSMMLESQNRIDAAQETLNNLKNGSVTGNKTSATTPTANDSFISNAKAHGYSDDQIQAYLKAKNGK